MKEPHWETVPDQTHRAWLELREPDGMYTASVRFDGCVHFTQICTPAQDGQPADTDYIHICHLDDFIARLQSLRDRAREHFGPDWPR